MKKHYIDKLDKDVYFLPKKMLKIVEWLEECYSERQILYLTDADKKLERKLESYLADKAFSLKKLARKELTKLTA